MYIVPNNIVLSLIILNIGMSSMSVVPNNIEYMSSKTLINLDEILFPSSQNNM